MKIITISLVIATSFPFSRAKMSPSISFQENTIQQVKAAADIVDLIGENVKLQKAGANYKGLCPFHGEKTPSFVVSPARQTFHCFGCSEGGDVISFYMKYHHMSFPEALKELARRYNILVQDQSLSPKDKEKARLREVLLGANEKAAEIYHNYLLHSEKAKGARHYLQKRQITQNIIAKFKLGYAPKSWDFLCNSLKKEIPPEEIEMAGLSVRKEKGGYYDRFRDRILFPIINMTGRVVGFGGRILGEGQPKYLNSPETMLFDKSRTLFGLFQNRNSIRKSGKGLIVEGNFDLLSLVNHGFDNVVAPLGTALTPNQIRVLKGYAEEAILLFDGDAAGIKAALRSVPLFLTEQMTAKVVVLPEKHDPDSYILEFGGGQLQEKIENAKPLSEFVFESLREKYGLSLEGKNKIVAELKPICSALANQPLQQTFFLTHFSQKLGMPAETLKAALKMEGSNRAIFLHNGKTAGPKKGLPQKQKQLLEFLILFPEYLADFLAAGIEDVINDASGRNILQALQELARHKAGYEPEQLLEILPHGSERSFVSAILIAGPAFADGVKETEAQEKLGWLRKVSFVKRKEKLVEKINKAQKDQNFETLIALLEEKKKLDNMLSS